LADDKKEPEVQEVKKKKSPIMLIVAGLLVLVIIAGGGYFFFSRGSSNSGSDKAEALAYFPLKTFVVNLAGNQGRRYLKVTMQFGINNPSLSKKLNAESIIMRDAIISILSSKLYDDISSEDGKNVLKSQIKHMVNKILKTGRINSVYFTTFVIQ